MGSGPELHTGADPLISSSSRRTSSCSSPTAVQPQRSDDTNQSSTSSWRQLLPALHPNLEQWHALYWQHQVAACGTYDLASCILKTLLLLGNVKRSLDHGELHAARCAAGAALLVFLSLLLMLLCQSQYVRYRRLVMWSNLVAISVMMATSMPQFLSATSSRLWGHRALVLLFKMGVTWPMMAALMHRLPWQDLAVLCGGFCVWLSVTWAQPLCNHTHGSPADAALIQSLAGMLDRVTGLGMDVAAVGGSSSSSSSSVGVLGNGGNSQVLFAPGAAKAGIGAGDSADNVWAPLAHHITAACMSPTMNTTSAFGSSGSRSSSSGGLSACDCDSLIMGQCLAVVTTFTVWVGVLIIMFFVVLAEQHSKWRWWHSSGARWQGPTPHVYAPASVWAFLGSRLLYLHVLLDLPLMLLWVGTSSWYRQPTAELGTYNLW